MTSAALTATRSRFGAIRDSLTPAEWGRIGAMAAIIVGLYVAGFTMLLAAASQHHHLSGGKVFGISTGLLALTLGVRHAFDADHISAIDNTTRKLMSEGKRPMSIGFFFSLGHSTIVFLLAVLLNFGIRSLDHQVKDNNSGLHTVTGIVGTSVSGTFLYVIAAINVVILVSIVRVFRDLRRGRYDEAELNRQLDQRGLMNRFFGGLGRRIDKPWKMYPLGILFGLGFDTATEVSLLVLSGTAVASGLPFYAILSLPLLFAAGMSTFDTLDGCFMNFAYGWAFSKPIRKVYYNITITGLSVAVAFLIGTIEILGLLRSEFGLGGAFFGFIGGIDINTAGFAIVGLFVATWVVALAVWHFGDIEGRWERAAVSDR
ncbi:MAG TPA: HoxN/HupN/NixA family nickel/cobalt transporter [Mycobacteriales bacterium]|nr:HoxN/HupN/NixA family nickel/cobalt transporter [Mycobacteriales bacterium]